LLENEYYLLSGEL